MNVACCLLVAAVAFTAWYRNEYIVVAHLHLLIGLSSTVVNNAYLHSLASLFISNTDHPQRPERLLHPAKAVSH